MRIAELAELTGVTPRQLRHFETQGLLRPARDERGWRDYDEQDRRRVEAISQLVRAGIPTHLAMQVLDVSEADLPQDPPRSDLSSNGLAHTAVPDQLLADILDFYRQVDSRARCLARNRDALATWLIEHGVHDLSAS